MLRATQLVPEVGLCMWVIYHKFRAIVSQVIPKHCSKQCKNVRKQYYCLVRHGRPLLHTCKQSKLLSTLASPLHMHVLLSSLTTTTSVLIYELYLYNVCSNVIRYISKLDLKHSQFDPPNHLYY